MPGAAFGLPLHSFRFQKIKKFAFLKVTWMLFDRVDVAELLARDAFAKGAYMLGAEDREIMLK